MTVALSGVEVAAKLEEKFPESVVESNRTSLVVRSQSLAEIISFLKTTSEFDFDFLNNVTSTDYFDYFEVVYNLTSFKHNHSLMIKTRSYDRQKPVVPSLVSLYQGADFQEREVYDLMGIEFEGHPNMKRILLWDGFQGHPLRKDYL
ncbi:MAG: NADH-quinone oxidoreductase subunit C [Dehalococcoidales bacterium]|jgi:NADH-quinone oxidoreductase subunit C|nr:NADH-quinone oxidoreductase subunit C [Dehalococcoidales bacterium]